MIIMCARWVSTCTGQRSTSKQLKTYIAEPSLPTRQPTARDVPCEAYAIKAKATERLLTERGVAYRKKRCWDVEPVFANLKHNKGFRRFILRGKEKVAIEAGLLALAHNLQKKVA